MRYFAGTGTGTVIGVCLILLLVFSFLGGEESTDLLEHHSSALGTRPGGLIDPAGMTIGTRVNTPAGFSRVPVAAGSFQEFLRNQPLKPHGSTVKYFDGREKSPHGVYFAVINRSIGSRDLEQCADALMRLRAEYLYSQKRYTEIQFNFLSDGRPRWYVDYAGRDRSYRTFLKYMDYIFSSANTTSFYNQLKPVKNLVEIKIGDIFIQKHRPINHAMIVIDMAVHDATGKKIFLLAQSYMPAQETQIVINPNNDKLSPWYSADFSPVLTTPEWVFYPAKDLRKF